MHTIKASEFKARCLSLMDAVAATGEVLIITKNGRPVAQLGPIQAVRAPSPFGWHRGQIRVLGDIIAPMASDDWEVLG